MSAVRFLERPAVEGDAWMSVDVDVVVYAVRARRAAEKRRRPAPETRGGRRRNMPTPGEPRTGAALSDGSGARR
jgi:hypothetical protein